MGGELGSGNPGEAAHRPNPGLARRLARPPYYAARHRLLRLRALARAARKRGAYHHLRKLHLAISLPRTVLFLFAGAHIDPAYELGWGGRLWLALRMYANTLRVQTGTSYKAHLAIAVKLLEIPPSVEGVVVECGCFQGGSTANLSLACELTGRRLIAYDSFEGLPPPAPGDIYANERTKGAFRGDLDTVRSNVKRLGAIECCEFRKGWFDQTLPEHSEPIVLAFFDVDYQSSLRRCVLSLWPHLVEDGYLFIDEYVLLDYCALFFSERFWRESFGTKPPGLVGAGAGVGVGEYYLGPVEEHRFRGPASVAYARKGLSGYWGYFPDEERTRTRQG